MNRSVLKNHYFFFILFILLLMLCLITIGSHKIQSSTALASDWQKRATQHFTLYYQRSDHLLADYIMERAEEDYERIVADIGIDPGIMARVYLAPDRNSYLALQPREKRTHEWSIGVFYPNQNMILLLSPKAQKASRPDLHQIMAHELTHFILHTVTREKGTVLPTWLHEGLAMYEARQWNWHYRRIMAQTALTRSFLPLSDMTTGFPAEKRLADRAYAQSISLIAYVINKYGVDDLHSMIKNLVEGRTPMDSFYNVFGLSIEEFEKNWHAYLRRRYTWVPFLTSSFTIWFLISILVLGIYMHKRRLAKNRMALWDIEDQIDSLS